MSLDALKDYEIREQQSSNGNGPDRYAGRRKDLASLLAEPPRPVAWRVDTIVADGSHTIIAGEGGVGKSWLAQALCTGISQGRAVVGLPCAQGRALYVDAEMGPQMFVDHRLRPAGITVPTFEYIDAMGLDVSKRDDLAWLQAQIIEVGANLVVIDSLRRLTPSKRENDSDDMAPAVAAISDLARHVKAAILTLHHRGDGDKAYRGSSAIKDQCDALFGLLREDGAVKLTCKGGKAPRYALEPEDVWLRVSPFDGGVAACETPRSGFGPTYGKTRSYVEGLILEALPVKTKVAAAAKVDRHPKDNVFCAAWARLDSDGEIVQKGGQWRGSHFPDPRDSEMTPSLSDERAQELFDRNGGNDEAS